MQPTEPPVSDSFIEFIEKFSRLTGILVWSVAYFLAVAAILVFGSFESKIRESNKPRPFWLGLLQYASTFFLFALAIAYVPYGYEMLGTRRGASDKTVMQSIADGDVPYQLIITMVLGLAGCLLYALRQHDRRIYALLELAFAGVTAFNSVKYVSQQQGDSSWMPLAAPVYLVVRGVDNLMIGIKSNSAPSPGHPVDRK